MCVGDLPGSPLLFLPAFSVFRIFRPEFARKRLSCGRDGLPHGPHLWRGPACHRPSRALSAARRARKLPKMAPLQGARRGLEGAEKKVLVRTIYHTRGIQGAVSWLKFAWATHRVAFRVFRPLSLALGSPHTDFSLKPPSLPGETFRAAQCRVSSQCRVSYFDPRRALSIQPSRACAVVRSWVEPAALALKPIAWRDSWPPLAHPRGSDSSRQRPSTMACGSRVLCVCVSHHAFTRSECHLSDNATGLAGAKHR